MRFIATADTDIGISKDRGSHEETMELDLLVFMVLVVYQGT